MTTIAITGAEGLIGGHLGCYLHGNTDAKVVRGGRSIFSTAESLDDVIVDCDVDGETPTFIDIPTMHTHNLNSTGSTELVTLFWSHEIFNPNGSDTYADMVNR